MDLKDVAKIIYTPETASINTYVKIITYSDNRTLWEGKAIDLQNWDNIKGWIIVEIKKNSEKEISEFGNEVPFYNKSWLITVI